MDLAVFQDKATKYFQSVCDFSKTIAPLFICIIFTAFFFNNIIQDNAQDLSMVIVNTKHIIADFSRTLSRNTNLSKQTKSQMITEFSVIYPYLVLQYAKQHNVIVFDQSEILTAPKSIKNITPLVEKQLSASMLQFLKLKNTDNKKD